MAKELYFLSPDDLRILNRVMERERKQLRRREPREGIRARSEALNANPKEGVPIAPNQTALVTVCDLDWNPITGFELEAHNPSGVTIPGDSAIRLVIDSGRGPNGSSQIRDAFLCEE